MIDSATVFRRLPDTRYRNIEGDGIVLRQTAAEVVVVNEVGARVLDLIDAHATFGQLIEALAGEYDVGRATLARDVAVHVQELMDAGVIEPVDITGAVRW